jgi:thymidylate synthase (FAD)
MYEPTIRFETYGKIDIQLIAAYPSEYAAQLAAATSMGKEDVASEKNLNAAVSHEHYSVLEHLPMTFIIHGVSRALTHQLVRHRIASYTQQSQRYTVIDTSKEWYVTPPTIKENNAYYNGETASSLYKEFMKKCASVYKELINKYNIPAEDARFVLPNACETVITITKNGRSFIEEYGERGCTKAQWEIRELYEGMREIIKDIYPTVYRLSQPKCMRNGICKEAKSCGYYKNK